MILSVSRRTDIPAFYSEWFYNRLKEGFLYVRNPMNPRQISSIPLSADIVDCIVFWSKNPAPMIPRLGELKDYCYYFQFTLNAYGQEVEPRVPPLSERIDTFFRLSELIGSERVVWRYDPIFFSEKYSAGFHIDAFGKLTERLKGHTEKCVFSFVDIYPTKNMSRMRRLSPVEAGEDEMNRLLESMSAEAKSCGLSLATCAESVDLEKYGIKHNSCIDKELIERLCGAKLKVGPDGQRPNCGCVKCDDIGSYDTCLHGCVYCYANFRPSAVAEKAANYDPLSPILCDSVSRDDRVSLRPSKSLKLPREESYDPDSQLTLF